MSTVELTPKRVLELIIMGIKNGNYDAVIAIAEDCIKQIDLREQMPDAAKEDK